MHRSTGTQRHDDIANNRSLRSLYFFFLQISLNAFSILIGKKLVSDIIFKNFSAMWVPSQNKIAEKSWEIGKVRTYDPKTFTKMG